MADTTHLAILAQGVATWNAWRESEWKVRPDLSGANLCRANLVYASLSRADLSGCDLSEARLDMARVTESDLSDANLRMANLSYSELQESVLDRANLQSANLRRVNLTYARLRSARGHAAVLSGADLTQADCSNAVLTAAHLDGAILMGTKLNGADLRGADLSRATLVYTEFDDRSDLRNSIVFGSSVWNVEMGGAKQTGLVITHRPHPRVTVDDLEVAQLVHLLLSSAKLRNVIDALTARAVLILGRFSDETLPALDAIRIALHQRGLSPIVFDFAGPESRDVTETVRTLAHLCRYVIADLTDPRSIPQELATIVPLLPSVPVQPIIRAPQRPWGMFGDLQRYPWVLPIYVYDSVPHLLSNLESGVIAPAEEAVLRLRPSSRP